MISVIAIGISEYNSNKISDIPCAFQDAQRVYATFKNALGESFCDFSSFSMRNLRRTEFESILKGCAHALSDDDILILYFSGHGNISHKDSDFQIVLRGDEGDNLMNGTTLRNVLSKFKGQCVLILDCCHSGAALSLANSPNALAQSSISVIASSQSMEEAAFDDSGSAFTKVLCDSIDGLFQMGQRLSIHSIASEIKGRKGSCFVNLAQGQHDVVFASKEKSAEDDKIKFVHMFLSKFYASNRSVREMMWYSLESFSPDIIFEAVKQFVTPKNKPHIYEADWLVRRAIGSVISNVDNHDTRKRETILSLLRSENWMLQTIGLIASRNSVDEEISRLLTSLIKNPDLPMSVTWLADLYYSDSSIKKSLVSIDSNLVKTSWGVIQIWNRYHEKVDNLYSLLTSACKDLSILEQLKIELVLRKELSQESAGIADAENVDFVEDALKSPLMQLAYKSSPRGSTKYKNKKWLLSLLFGNWRGQLSVDYQEYFENHRSKRISHDLELMEKAPGPEKRSSIFTYMQYHPEHFRKYKRYLYWGLSDSHPWVRRDAVIAFKDEPEAIKTAFEDVIDRKSYIGTFDLILNSVRYVGKGFLYDYVKKYATNLTDSEYASLLHAIGNE